ncbi:acyltransferase family protein [Marinagarivorans cellulosilyticus]|uniref:Acyltransferase 3 domain-containing protein n=1 Tax=Marinagarivorans cellulosilyticus TaxID=2721545 RepID=A0AAN2BM74_9GAMM|nr:acyltransferase family protein [Marinagarivorans cellulosilyticus]BCD99873.1 hypothetical protein MARGE09_P4075 [Marinagarivorans cellulosilyticus]
MTQPMLKNQRLDYLDAVRAFALLLGIVFHASLSFMPLYIGWAVMDISTSPVVPVFMLISHSFRMELFFLIAGFFSHMAFHNQGTKAFIQSRTVRIAIPFIIGWLILRPLIVSGWIMGAASLRGDVDISGALLAGVTTLGELPKGFLTGSHLWFLYYLLLLTAVILVARCAIYLHTPIKNYLAVRADKALCWVCSSPFALIALAIPTAVCLWFMDHWGVDTPDKSLIPHIPVTLLYGGIFLFGWLMHRQANCIDSFSRITGFKVALCLFSVGASVKLSSFEMQTGLPYYTWLKVNFMLSYAVMMWTLIALTLGLFKTLFNRQSKIIRYFSDASYWLYLIHLPIVVWLQVAFAELPLHWGMKWALISSTTIIFSIILYDTCVRATLIGAILNGKKRKRLMSVLK